MARLRLAASTKGVLGELYRRTHRTVDDLPYTDEFEALYTEFVARTGLTMTRHDVWKALAGCRKQCGLIRKERQPTQRVSTLPEPPPKVEAVAGVQRDEK